MATQHLKTCYAAFRRLDSPKSVRALTCMPGIKPLLNPKRGTLRVHSSAGHELGVVISLLADIQQAYVAAYLFFTYSPSQLLKLPPIEDDATAEVPILSDLTLQRVSLSSPGFWEFLGALNPLKVIADYLQQAHERRKDHTYRNRADQQRLQHENEQLQIENEKRLLENELLRNKVVAERIEFLKRAGIGQRALQQLLLSYLARPLATAQKHTRSGLIESVEIVEQENSAG